MAIFSLQSTTQTSFPDCASDSKCCLRDSPPRTRLPWEEQFHFTMKWICCLETGAHQERLYSGSAQWSLAFFSVSLCVSGPLELVPYSSDAIITLISACPCQAWRMWWSHTLWVRNILKFTTVCCLGADGISGCTIMCFCCSAFRIYYYPVSSTIVPRWGQTETCASFWSVMSCREMQVFDISKGLSPIVCPGYDKLSKTEQLEWNNRSAPPLFP